MSKKIIYLDDAIDAIKALCDGASSAQPTQSNTPNALTALDCISRHAALDECLELAEARRNWGTEEGQAEIRGIDAVMCALHDLPSVQPEKRTEERTETHACDYCHEDSDGYVKPIEKNCHAVIFGSVLYLKAEGWHGEVEIKYCPMCGRRLER